MPPRTIVATDIEFNQLHIRKNPDTGEILVTVDYMVIFDDNSRQQRHDARRFTSGTAYNRLGTIWANAESAIRTKEGL